MQRMRGGRTPSHTAVALRVIGSTVAAATLMAAIAAPALSSGEPPTPIHAQVTATPGSTHGDGLLAYVSTRVGNPEIYLMAPDGGVQIDLSNDPATDTQPAWSPDGSRIAFTSSRNGNAEIYVMNADGSDPLRLTATPGSDSQPAWSPDGSKIAFVSTRDGNPEIYAMNADGTNPLRLTTNPASDS